MNKLQHSVYILTLLALLSSLFLFAFVSETPIGGGTCCIHAKDGKEMLSQAYYLEESELDLDEKFQEYKNATFLLISFCFSFLFLLKANLKSTFLNGIYSGHLLGLASINFLTIRVIRL